MSMAIAMTLAVVMCLILMPLISVSDDLLEAQQAALPISGQTWRLASEDASAGLDDLLMVGLYLLLLMCFRTEAPASQRARNLTRGTVLAARVALIAARALQR